MKRYIMPLMGVLLCSLVVNSQPTTTTAHSASTYEPRIISSDFEKIVFEITVPPIRMLSSTVEEARGQMVALSGYSQTATPGAPQVPVRGFSIGIPEDANPTLHILEHEVETRHLHDVPPAPGIKYERTYENADRSGDHTLSAQADAEIFERPADIRTQYVWERDESVYGRNEYYPEEPITLGKDGIMRDQRLITFQLYPVQYNPVQNRIRYTKTITFAIYYNGHSRSIYNEGNASEAFESVFQSTLLNYEIAKNWRIPRSLKKPAQDDYFLTQGEEWYKILLETPGIYVLEKSDLDSAGLDTDSFDPRYLKMFNKGVEIAIHVIGEEDGSFDESDTIEFYGTAFKNYYTTTNVYWLTVSNTLGKRMQVKDGTVTGDAPVLTRGRETLHYEIDNFRRADFPGHTDNERWFTTYVIAPSIKTFTVNLNNISDIPASDCKFILRN